MIGEQHARRALLSEVCEELAVTPELAPLRKAALSFLHDLECGTFPESHYAHELECIVRQFRSLNEAAANGAAA
jgi:hypothetical protein